MHTAHSVREVSNLIMKASRCIQGTTHAGLRTMKKSFCWKIALHTQATFGISALSMGLFGGVTHCVLTSVLFFYTFSESNNYKMRCICGCHKKSPHYRIIRHIPRLIYLSWRCAEYQADPKWLSSQIKALCWAVCIIKSLPAVWSFQPHFENIILLLTV